MIFTTQGRSALDAGGRRQVDLAHTAAREPAQKPEPAKRSGNSFLPCLVPYDGRFSHHGANDANVG